MSIKWFLVLFVVFTVSCEDKTFKGSQQVAPVVESADVNGNTIPDDFEDPKVLPTDPTTVNTGLGGIFIPDGQGGFTEIEAAYEPTPEGLVQIDEILKNNEGTFFQVDNPNKPNDNNHPPTVTTATGSIPDGFRDVTDEIYIKTADGFVKIDLYKPTNPTTTGGFTDPSTLTEDNTAKIPAIIIPDVPAVTPEPEPTPVTSLPGREPTTCETEAIDFEDMIGSPGNTKVSNQYLEKHGVSFELSDGTKPVLIERDKNHDTNVFTGWVCNHCTDGIPYTNGSGVTGGTRNGILPADQRRLGNYSIGGPNKDRHLIVNYTSPVNEASGTLIDVDGEEQWDIIALDAANKEVGRTTVKSPLNDGVGTDWNIKTDSPFVKLELKFSLSNKNLGGGLALDLFSPAKACVPESE